MEYNNNAFEGANFHSLPEDVVGEIATVLDLPTRFAFAHTCPAFRARYWATESEYSLPKGYALKIAIPVSPELRISMWRVVDECARRGYLALLKDMVESGCAVDSRVLELAIKGDHDNMVKWLGIVLAPQLQDKGSQYDERFMRLAKVAAKVNNSAWVRKYRPTPNYGMYISELLKVAAKYGHVYLVIDLLNEKAVSLSGPRLARADPGPTWSDAVYQFAFWNRTEAYQNFVANMPRYDPLRDLQSLLRGAGNGGNIELFELAHDLGARVDPRELPYHGLAKSLQFLEVFHAKYPTFLYAAENFQKIADALTLYPNLGVAKWLVARGFKFQVGFRSHRWFDIASSSIDFEGLPPQAYEKRPEKLAAQAADRFSVIKFLNENASLRWTADDMGGSVLWASIDQFKWLHKNCTGDQSLLESAVETFATQVFNANMAILDYIIDEGAEITKKFMLNIFGFENNLAVLTYLHNRFDLDPFASVKGNYLSTLSTHLGLKFNSRKFSHLDGERLRIRWHNAAQIFEFLLAIGFRDLVSFQLGQQIRSFSKIPRVPPHFIASFKQSVATHASSDEKLLRYVLETQFDQSKQISRPVVDRNPNPTPNPKAEADA